MDPYATHVPVLAKAVMMVPGPVLELGVGYYSAPLLHELCLGRELVTAETADEQEWMERFRDFGSVDHKLELVEDWATWPLLKRRWGVALVDHQPGERRKETLELLAGRATVIVVHDTEHPAYDYEPGLSRFKRRWDYTRLVPWTTLVSNFRPLPL